MTRKNNSTTHKPPSTKNSHRLAPTIPTTSRLPKNWPASLPYLTRPTYSPTIPTTVLAELHTPPPPQAATEELSAIPPLPPPLPAPHVRILPITSPSHPAHGQSGLFATTHLPPSSLIIPYTGRVHGPALPQAPEQGTAAELVNGTQEEAETEGEQEADEDEADKSDYDLSLGPRDLRLGIDAASAGNEARFVNDYRGVGPAGPNAEFREMWVRVAGTAGAAKRGDGVSVGMVAGKKVRVERWMGVFVLPAGKSGRGAKGIRKGEEVLVSYGKGYWMERGLLREGS